LRHFNDRIHRFLEGTGEFACPKTLDTRMLTSALAAILTGGALGLCFRVLVLVPVSLAAIGLIAIAGIASGLSLPLLAEQMIVAVVLLQAGYGVGLVTRHVTTVARAPALRKAVAAVRRTGMSRI
jgi:hypothetical protein